MAKYTTAELDTAAIADLLNDARCSELQAIEGPFYPDRDITAETLMSYASQCRAKAAKYANGGAHSAVLAE
jgi:hypothetical protein